MPPASPSAGAVESGRGAGPGANEPGFDVTGSHPLPNADDREAPGRGACACGLVPSAVEGRAAVTLLALGAVAMRARRRRTVAR
jgi:hypothetical protein